MKTSTYILVILSIVSYSVIADEKIEPDNDQRLMTSCQALAITPEHEDAKPCIYFIQGFLAAAQAIDPPVINQQAKKTTRSYGLMSRPSPGWAKISPTRFFPICVADDEMKIRVIKIVAKQLPSQIETVNILRDTIFKALKAEYPCGKPNQN